MKLFSLALLFLTACHSASGLSPVKSPAPKNLSTAKDRSEISNITKQSVLLEKKQPDSAIRMIREGLNRSRQLHYFYGEALMMARFAQINERYGNYTTALKYQTAALELFQQHGQWNDLANARVELGRIYGKLHQPGPALQYLQQALDTFLQQKDLNGRISALTTMGQVNEFNARHQDALRNDTAAEKLMLRQPVSEAYFPLILHIGKVQEKLGNNHQALAYYETGISKSDNSKFSSWHITLLRQAGSLWDKIGEHDSASLFHQRSLIKARQYQLPEEEARSQLSLAMSARRKDADQSILHLKKALELSRNVGNRYLTAEIFRSLSDLYQQQSRYQEALSTLQQHHKLVDSLQRINTGHQLALLQGSYELAENKLHIQALEITNSKRIQERNFWLQLAVLILVILFIVIYLALKTKKLNQALEQSNTTKDKLFSIIGHDLRNPIGGITQLLALMDEQHLSKEESVEMVAKMRKQGDVTLEILNALLNWGEAQLKGIHVKNTIFRPDKLVRKNLDVLSKQAADKQLVISDEVPAGISLYGDANHYDFIIRNLLSNAIKFSPLSGTIRIASAPGTNGQFVFSVQDQGKGISEAQQLQFRKTNLDVSFGTSGEKGTGIGLLLSKEFVRANGGDIWISSTPGAGTTFYFSFNAGQDMGS